MSSLLLLSLLAAEPEFVRVPPFAPVADLGKAAEPTKERGDENRFTHGPILGRLGSDRIGVWTRMLRPGRFVVRYGTDQSRLDQTSDEVAVGLATDLCGWVLIDGLQPGTRYWYEIQNPDSTGRSGRGGTFRTLPAGKADPKWNPRGLFNFKFEVASCQNLNPYHGNGPAMPGVRQMNATLAGDRPGAVDFAIANGDWLYEARRDFGPDQWADANSIADPSQRPDFLDTIPTVTGVWENYKFFLDQSPPLQQWHANVPCYFTFDDHEILNDIWGAGEPGLVDRRAVFRDIGLKAWYDYVGWANEMPHPFAIQYGTAQLTKGSDVLTDESAAFDSLPWDDLQNLHVHWGTETAGVNENELDTEPPANPNAGVYAVAERLSPTTLRIEPPARADSTGSYSIGQTNYWKKTIGNCDFFYLDTRGMRGLHDTSEPFKTGLSLLGEKQSAWLQQQVKASEADFLFIVSTVPYMIPHVGGEAIRDGAIGGGKDEAWTVFLEEREMLTDLFDSLGKPVIILTGDLHNSFAIQITDNVYEFACGPLNSNNHTAADEAFRPPNGEWQYGPRPIDILWSTWFPQDISRANLKHITYATVQVNNVFNAPQTYGQNDRPNGERLIAFPRPQVVISYFDGHTGELRFAHSIRAAKRD